MDHTKESLEKLSNKDLLATMKKVGLDPLPMSAATRPMAIKKILGQ